MQDRKKTQIKKIDFGSVGEGDEQGGLVCCDSWGCKESDMTE